MVRKRAGKLRRISCGVLLGLAALCLAGGGISAWSNRSLPKGPQVLEQLDPLDQTRLEETLHLKATLGDRVWPGMGGASIPISLHNQKYSFLTGYPGTPPTGWEVVRGETFAGQLYYRKSEEEPQNFAIQVGNTWVAGMATKAETDRFIVELYQGLLPPVLEQIFPYRLLLQPSEVQIGGVLHECFHVFQAQNNPRRLEAAEEAHRQGERYWEADPKVLDLWKEEMNLLAKALKAKTDGEAIELTRQFLADRSWRRQEAGLSAEMIGYERQLEWEEGLAKYVELEFLRQAFTAKDYKPIETMKNDPSFKAYQTYKQRWSQEILQMKLEANQEGEVSFYMTGMAQAFLLDRLGLVWKTKALTENTFLEDLLQEALAK